MLEKPEVFGLKNHGPRQDIMASLSVMNHEAAALLLGFLRGADGAR